MSLEIRSAAFRHEADIPERHTCDGMNLSPPLEWSSPPAGTQGYALIAEDPDAPGGIWTHWVLYNLPADLTGLAEGIPGVPAVPRLGTQGVNGFRKVGYGGPCPPRGPAHRYYFRLYALDQALDLEARLTREEVRKAMQGHILGEAELMGRYRRP